MKRFLAATAILFCLTGIVPAADKQLVGLMMPDAKVLGGVSVAQVRNSPYGQYLLTQFPLTNPEFQQFVLATGLDPTRDITEIVGAASGLPNDKAGLAAARGAFDIAHILGFVKTMGGNVDQSQGVPVITSPDGQMAIALLDPTLAIAGDPNNVIAAVGRRSAPSTLDPVLSAKAAALSGSQDAWVVSTITPAAMGLPAGSGPAGPGGLNLSALQNIQQSSAGVKFGTSVSVVAEAVADTPQNANALADIVRLMVSLARMSQSNPQAAQFTALLDNLTVQTKGTAIELSLAIPEEMFEQLSPTKGPQVLHRRVALRK